MKEISEKEVLKLAKLSRLQFSDAEIAGFKKDLTSMIAMIDKLQSIDTSSVEPLNSVGATVLPMRKDVVTENDKADDILANAPKQAFNCFKVPKVIEEE